MQINTVINALDQALLHAQDTNQAAMIQHTIHHLSELQELRSLCKLTGWRNIHDWLCDYHQDAIKCQIIYHGQVQIAYYHPDLDEFTRGKFPINPLTRECIKWVKTIN